MSKYQKPFAPGATYLFTARFENRGGKKSPNCTELLRAAYASAMESFPLTCHAMVVLPDHIHAVWTLPASGCDISLVWKEIEAIFSSHLPPAPHSHAGKLFKGKAQTWHCKFWRHAIRDAADFQRQVDYCHFDPVKHGMVRSPDDWPISTVHHAPMSEMILA